MIPETTNNHSKQNQERDWYVRVVIPELPKKETSQDNHSEKETEYDLATDIFGETNYLTLKDEYEFWGKGITRHYPAFHRWYSQDARDFEKGLLQRMRSLSRKIDFHFQHKNEASAEALLNELELTWIWEELTSRGLKTEAMSAMKDSTHAFLSIKRNQVQTFSIFDFQGPMKNILLVALLTPIILYTIPYCTSFIIKSASDLLPGVLDFLRSLKR